MSVRPAAWDGIRRKPCNEGNSAGVPAEAVALRRNGRPDGLGVHRHRSSSPVLEGEPIPDSCRSDRPSYDLANGSIIAESVGNVSVSEGHLVDRHGNAASARLSDRDGGDARSGAGTEIGGGATFADSPGALTIGIAARTLLVHADDGFRYRGVSGSLQYDPLPDTEQGLMLSFRPAAGEVVPSGVDGLFGRATMADPVGFSASVPGGRIASEASFGLSILGGRYAGVPQTRFGLPQGGRESAAGWRFVRARRGGVDLSAGVEGNNRARGKGCRPERGIAAQLTPHW